MSVGGLDLTRQGSAGESFESKMSVGGLHFYPSKRYQSVVGVKQMSVGGPSLTRQGGTRVSLEFKYVL